MNDAPTAYERASFAGKRVLVMGLGRFDGGLGTVRFLCQEGAHVLVSDQAERAALEASAKEAEGLGATLRFGPQEGHLLDEIDCVVANPAIPFVHPLLETARTRGIPITTEINIVLARSPAPIYGVTGTKGKSTTSSLLAGMLRAAGHRVHLGGNIGRSLVARLAEVDPQDRLVLELSSFQLWWAHHVRVSPHVTVVTNLLSDHLDRHGTQAAYADAKRAALDYQGPRDLAVLPVEDVAVRDADWHAAGAARRVFYGPDATFRLDGRTIRGPGGEADLSQMALLGAHNLRNALAAATALMAGEDGSWAAVRQGAGDTQPLPHRLAPVAEIDDVLYIDDSNATHPNSTLSALVAVDRPIVLIAGGKEKGSDPSELLAAIARHAKAVVTIGSSSPVLERALSPHLRVVAAGDMSDAVHKARDLASAGDAVLLSPAYSSLDQYASFAERGAQFAASVRSLKRDM